MGDTCCFTGHREIPEGERARLKKRLKKTLTALIEEGVCYFGAGGARGFDTLAAQTVLELKKRHPHIRLILVLPCKDQTRGWGAEDTAVYEHILARADKVVWLAERYYRGCMHVRNRRLADNAQVCVCYLTKPTGGTAYTVNYAREKGLRIINMAET
jgi:uncharacterized phage-like protein YoqJ